MTENVSLKSEFEQIRKDYFPRWDRKRRWRIRFSSDLDGNVGRCRSRKKLIEISLRSGLTRTVTIIHEICHAFGIGHGNPWQRRMLKAAEQLKPRLDLEYNFLGSGFDFTYNKGTDAAIRNLITENYKVGVNFEMPLFLRKERGKLQQTDIKLLESSYSLQQKRLMVNNKVLTYYNEWRTHRSLDGDAPDVRAVRPAEPAKVVEFPAARGLHHHYLPEAA